MMIFRAETVCNRGLFQYDLCYNYFCIYAPLALPFLRQLQLGSLLAVVRESASPFMQEVAVTVPVQHLTLLASLVIAPSAELSALCPFSLLTCPFPLSQIFLQACLIGALLSFPFFGLPPCQSNAIRPGAGANLLLWLLLRTNPLLAPCPKIPKSQWSGKTREPGER